MKYASAIQSRSRAPAVRICSMRAMRILAGSWMTTRAVSSPAEAISPIRGHSSAGRAAPARFQTAANVLSTSATAGPRRSTAVSR
jgi:hypothetical protein